MVMVFSLRRVSAPLPSASRSTTSQVPRPFRMAAMRVRKTPGSRV